MQHDKCKTTNGAVFANAALTEANGVVNLDQVSVISKVKQTRFVLIITIIVNIFELFITAMNNTIYIRTLRQRF